MAAWQRPAIAGQGVQAVLQVSNKSQVDRDCNPTHAVSIDERCPKFIVGRPGGLAKVSKRRGGMVGPHVRKSCSAPTRVSSTATRPSSIRTSASRNAPKK